MSFDEFSKKLALLKTYGLLDRVVAIGDVTLQPALTSAAPPPVDPKTKWDKDMARRQRQEAFEKKVAHRHQAGWAEDEPEDADEVPPDVKAEIRRARRAEGE